MGIDVMEPQNSGYIFAHPSPGEEVVITGLSGKFSSAKNVYEFRDNLFNGVNMTDAPMRGWEYIKSEVYNKLGSIEEIQKFDAGFFGLHKRHAENTDVKLRLILEAVVEAVLDSGTNPVDLEGTNTGVFIALSTVDSEIEFYNFNLPNAEIPIGFNKSMYAQRVSYHLKLNGPSHICDNLCSSSIFTLNMAYECLRSNKCDRAIVAGVHICLSPKGSLMLARIGTLSQDGRCKVFDESADGFVRGESVSALMLQKKKDARRIYARVIHGKSNSNGFNENGIMFPSAKMQVEMMEELYNEASVSVSNVRYVEAHGTGTKAGDREEISAIDKVYCRDQFEQVRVGSVKSNMGHAEPAAGLCGIAKVIMAMETGYIPPNIHFRRPRQDIEALISGRIEVVTKKTKHNGFMAISNFGLGGVNCHVVLEQNRKDKINGGIPEDDLPRLVCVSGRTKEWVVNTLNDLKGRNLDDEFIRLCQNLYQKGILNEKYRGHVIISKSGELKRSLKPLEHKLQTHLFFTTLPNMWMKKVTILKSFPMCSEQFSRIEKIISNFLNINLNTVLENGDIYNESYLVIMTFIVHVCFIEIFKTIGLVPDQLEAVGIGRISLAYYKGIMCLETATKTVCATALAIMFRRKYILHSNIEVENVLKEILISQLHEKDVSIVMCTPKICQSPDSVKELENSITIQIGEDNTRFSNQHTINFTDDNENDLIVYILNKLGSLYEHGVDLKIGELYPKIKWPVSRGTPMISPNINWLHEDDWTVPDMGNYAEEHNRKYQKNYAINTKLPMWAFLNGHQVDDTVLFPASGFVYLAWETFAEFKDTTIEQLNVCLKNVKFLSPINLPENTTIEITVTLQVNGNFEITYENNMSVTGNICMLDSEDVILEDFLDDNNDENNAFLTDVDIYKELWNRGYHYRGAFRGLIQCNRQMNKGFVKWQNNWITFIDTSIHFIIINLNRWMLYVPTGFTQMILCPTKHTQYINNGTVEAFLDHENEILRVGGMQLCGHNIETIARKKRVDRLVLETYKFVPNESSMNLHNCLRTNLQIIQENNRHHQLKVIEIVDNQSKNNSIIKEVENVLNDEILVYPDIKQLFINRSDLQDNANSPLKFISSKNSLVIGTNLLQYSSSLLTSLKSLDANGYVLSLENLENDLKLPSELQVLTKCKCDDKILVLVKKQTKSLKLEEYNVVRIIPGDMKWLKQLQTYLKKDSRIILVSQKDVTSGLLGLFKCLLEEKEADKLTCFFIMDPAPIFSLEKYFYSKQLEKGFAVNVYQGKQWGTYRHLQLPAQVACKSEQIYLNLGLPGDISSLQWIEKPTSKNANDNNSDTIEVHYAALNSKDLMTVKAKIPVREKIFCYKHGELGIEFAGVDASTREGVFGIVDEGALSSTVSRSSAIVWPIPKHWTMEQAVTVPVAYCTVLNALKAIGGLKPHQKILIHAGCSSIGLAAINIALHYNCTVFTTVGNEEERNYILQKFPEIPDNRVGNSRNQTFVQMVMEHTEGKGVDVVLNSSLQPDLLPASLDCVKNYGNFIGITKLGTSLNYNLGMEHVSRQIKVSCTTTNKKYTPDMMDSMHKMLADFINIGAVKPLHRTIFDAKNHEEAFQYAISGRSVGKIVLKFSTVDVNSDSRYFQCKQMFYCDEDLSYVVCGGFGGVGMAVLEWLVGMGCKKLVLVSRKQNTTGYIGIRFDFFKREGVTVKTVNEDLATREGCINLLQEANILGPVDAIFNIAVTLKDDAFKNQTEESFQVPFVSKVMITRNLDEVSRNMCPKLRHFVVFSSMASGRGNECQTNYGMANSIAENICEQRRAQGYPAVAIQWGPIGDVGIIADLSGVNKNISIMGAKQQRISSCLDVLKICMLGNETIVSSIVVMDKKSTTANREEVVRNMLGIKDIKTININLTFAELGLDSLIAVELKQVIEKEYNVTFNVGELKTVSFAKLRSIAAEKEENKK